MGGRAFTDEQREFMYAHYGRIPTAQIAARFGRSVTSISNLAKHLGIPKDRGMPAEETQGAALVVPRRYRFMRPELGVRSESSVGLTYNDWGEQVAVGDRHGAVIHRTPEELGIASVLPPDPPRMKDVRPYGLSNPGGISLARARARQGISGMHVPSVKQRVGPSDKPGLKIAKRSERTMSNQQGNGGARMRAS